MGVKVGDLRPSQLIFTFGIGATVELPRLTAIMMGLEEWDQNYASEISEERVLQAVQAILGHQVERLCAPPIPDQSDALSQPNNGFERIGVPVATFPTWLRCPLCNRLGRVDSGLFQRHVVPRHPEKTEYQHTNCQRIRPGTSAPTVLPARFLMACVHGHLDDFPWIDYVHSGGACEQPRLILMELGISGTAAEVIVKCESCGKARSMSDAFEGKESENQYQPPCTGRHPHLRDPGSECDQAMKTMLLGASNSWFSLTVSALFIPAAVDTLSKLVEAHWSILDKATDVAVVTAFRRIGQLHAFGNYTDEEIWKAVEAKRSGSAAAQASEERDIKGPEWRVLSSPDALRNTVDFELREVDPPPEFAHLIDKVVLAERLREVRALVGFARVESPGDFGETFELPPNRRAPISRMAPRWVPASEVRGEGVFIQFREDVLTEWLSREENLTLENEYLHAYRQWRAIRNLPPDDTAFPGLRYVLLHSFSHALMRQFSLECGYSAASLRERIYSRSGEEDGGPMAGVLIYTAAPDSEGTLGGLVSLGQARKLGRHLDQAFERIRLCAADPLCAEHHPSRDGVTLHGAACHACLFAPETSCERGNKFLDRSVLVETVKTATHAFFESSRSES